MSLQTLLCRREAGGMPGRPQRKEGENGARPRAPQYEPVRETGEGGRGCANLPHFTCTLQHICGCEKHQSKLVSAPLYTQGDFEVCLTVFFHTHLLSHLEHSCPGHAGAGGAASGSCRTTLARDAIRTRAGSRAIRRTASRTPMRAGTPALHAAWSALRPGQHLLTLSV